MEARKFQQFNQEEEVELFHRMKAGDQEARRLLIESQIAWVRKVADKFCKLSGWKSYEDAESIALLHLIHVVDHKFDPSRGRLSTLMGWATRNMLSRSKNKDRLIALPSTICEREDLRLLAESAYVLTSIHKDVNAHRSVIDVPYQRPGFDHDAEEARNIRRLRRAMKGLDSRYRKILRLRMEGRTLLDVGKQFGICKERVRQIETKALDQLRTKLIKKAK